MSNEKLSLAVIVGSHRQNSQSTKVSNFIIENCVSRLKTPCEVSLIDLAKNPLPLWDESFWDRDPKWDTSWKPISDKLKKADGIIVISPEWAGMVPAGLKNLFLFCNRQELYHKPGLIVSVSAGTGGAYPVTELRSSSYKNSQICYIPEHAIVRDVNNVLNDAEKPVSESDRLVRERLSYSVQVLEQYALSMKRIRESGVLDPKKFPNGQ